MRSLLKKISCGLLALVAAVLCSCDQLVYIPDDIDKEKVSKIMEEKLTQLFYAVEQKDEKAFDSFFDDQALTMTDFEDGKSYVFDIYKGNLIDVNFRAAGHTGSHIEPGERRCYAYMTFNVITSETEYRACVEFYTKYESKYPDDPYKIRHLSLFPKLSDGTFIPIESDGNFDRDWIDFGLGYGIYYPGWRDGIE